MQQKSRLWEKIERSEQAVERDPDQSNLENKTRKPAEIVQNADKEGDRSARTSQY